jgi:hypothetical protein
MKNHFIHTAKYPVTYVISDPARFRCREKRRCSPNPAHPDRAKPCNEPEGPYIISSITCGSTKTDCRSAERSESGCISNSNGTSRYQLRSSVGGAMRQPPTITDHRQGCNSSQLTDDNELINERVSHIQHEQYQRTLPHARHVPISTSDGFQVKPLGSIMAALKGSAFPSSIRRDVRNWVFTANAKWMSHTLTRGPEQLFWRHGPQPGHSPLSTRARSGDMKRRPRRTYHSSIVLYGWAVSRHRAQLRPVRSPRRLRSHRFSFRPGRFPSFSLNPGIGETSSVRRCSGGRPVYVQHPKISYLDTALQPAREQHLLT